MDLGEIALEGAGEVQVEVVEEGGVPVAGVMVGWTEARRRDEALNPRVNPFLAEATWIAVGCTGADGRVAAKGLPCQVPVAIRALVDGTVPVVAETEIASEDRAGEVRILVPARHTLTVSCRYASGEAVGPVRLTHLDGPPGARWVREFPGQEGVLRVRLPQGRYEVAVQAARKRLVRREVVLDRDLEVSLDLHGLATVEVHVLDPDGRPVPRFDAAFGGPAAGDILNLFLAGNSYRGTDGRVLLEAPIPAPDDPVLRRCATVVIRASGFGLGRAEIRSPLDEPGQAVTVRLARGVTILGRVAGLPEGTEVRLHYLRDASGLGWPAADAPCLASGRADAQGEFALPGLGPGTYELLAVSPSMLVPLGAVSCAAAGDVPFEAEYEPASLSVALGPAGPKPGPAEEPILIPLLPPGKWGASRTEIPARTAISGTRKGATLVFDGLAPGRYLLDSATRPGRAWGASPRAIRLALERGENLTVEWAVPMEVAHARIRVSLPASIRNAEVVYATFPETAAPQFMAALAWSPLGPDDSGDLSLPAKEPFVLVVSKFLRASEFQGVFREVSPLAIARFVDVRAAEGASVLVEEPASLSARGSPELVRLDVTQEWTDGLLRDRWAVRGGERLTCLMPGRYRIRIITAGASGVGARIAPREETVVLSPGEHRDLDLSTSR